MELKLPENRLFELGFEALDYIYGELTIKDGEFYERVLVDKYNIGRLACQKHGPLLGYLSTDRSMFLSIIPVGVIDYRRVLRAWVKERYKIGTKEMTISLRGPIPTKIAE